MVRVRKMQARDVPAVLALWDENCLETGGDRLSPDERQRVSHNLHGYVDRDEACCLAAEEVDELLGFVTFSLVGHPVMSGLVGEIEELYVRPEARGRGTGSALVRDATAELRRRGASVVRALVCNDAVRALQFWRGQGWENDMTVFTLYGSE